MSRWYTGIGSRSAPQELRPFVVNAARVLRSHGFSLRSGGAAGPDSWFEAGAAGAGSEIYLPGKGWRGSSSPLYEISQAALDLAERFHPAWERCSPFAKRLQARNSYQMLGSELDTPSEFVVCWTPKGARVGGTAQALRIADHFGVPIFNIATDPKLSRLATHLGLT